MKKWIFAATLVLVAVIGCETAGDERLIGDWEIIEFRLIGQSGDPVSDEETLRNAGAVWNLEFSRDGDFKQAFNMRNRDMEMEVEQGSWRTVDDTLKIELQIDTITSKMDYTYEIDGDVLTLTLAPKEVNAKIITKFREK